MGKIRDFPSDDQTNLQENLELGSVKKNKESKQASSAHKQSGRMITQPLQQASASLSNKT